VNRAVTSELNAAIPPDPFLVEIRNLSVRYRVSGQRSRSSSRWLYALDQVSIGISRGITTAIVGETGCGKTTLARSIACLAPADHGSELLLGGIDLYALRQRERRRALQKIQLVFQDPYSSFDPRRKLAFSMIEPLSVLGRNVRRDSIERQRVYELVERVGISPDALVRYPRSLSGGQLQRLNIARALVPRPELLVLDEPLSALDVSLQAQILNLLRELRQDFGLTYVLITHDLAILPQIAHRVVVIYLGRVIEEASVEQFFAAPAHPYSAALLSAIPIPDPVEERRRTRIVLEGDPPSPVNVPRGCRFHPRCWLRSRIGNPEICAAEEPPLAVVGPGMERRVACHFHQDAMRAWSQQTLHSAG
jgi:peptide/nickel transport system ATP-binding protein